jgi:hypothetical protein
MPIHKTIAAEGYLSRKQFTLTREDLTDTAYAFLLGTGTKRITDNTSDNGRIFFAWCALRGRQADEEIWVEDI